MSGTQLFAVGSLPTTTLWVGIGACIVLVAMGFVALYLALGLRKISVVVEADALVINAPFYGRRIPRGALKLDQIKVRNGIEDDSVNPRKFGRKNGIALPGHRVGWYRSKTGERALELVTDLGRVVSIPTTEGYSVFVSVDQPDELVAALKNPAGSKSIPVSPGSSAALGIMIPTSLLLFGLAAAFAYVLRYSPQSLM